LGDFVVFSLGAAVIRSSGLHLWQQIGRHLRYAGSLFH
jgi:hypothetical protein